MTRSLIVKRWHFMIALLSALRAAAPSVTRVIPIATVPADEPRHA